MISPKEITSMDGAHRVQVDVAADTFERQMFCLYDLRSVCVHDAKANGWEGESDDYDVTEPDVDWMRDTVAFDITKKHLAKL